MIKHGGNIHKFSKITNRHYSTIMDFSANINPLRYPDGLKEYLLTNIDLVSHYPDPEYIELRKAIANYIGIEEDSIIPGNGAIEVIDLCIRSAKRSKLLIPIPTFSEYERIARINNIGIEYLSTEEDFSIDLERLIKKIVPKSMLILCNPNNPTGTLMDTSSIKYLLDRLQELDVLLIVDEAFIEFTENYPESSSVRFVNSYPNLFIIRCFTKFFGLPGLRLGYGVGDRGLINRIRETILPWSVNILADLAGRYVLKDKSFMEETRRVIAEERKFLYRELSNIEWISPYPSMANFILAKISIDLTKLEQFLLKEGIFIRNCHNFRGLDSSYIRIAVKDHRSNLRLIETLHAFPYP